MIDPEDNNKSLTEELDELPEFEQDTGTLKWLKLRCAGDIPSPRSGHSLTVINNCAFVFGGSGENSTIDENGIETFGPSAEMYCCRLEAAGSRQPMRWERVTTGGEAPLPRWGHTATVIDKTTFVVFGGFHTDTNRFNDLHIFDTQRMTWMQPITSMVDFTPRGNHVPKKGTPSTVPDPRGGHTTTLVGTTLVVFGGYGGNGYARRDFNDVALFDLEGQEWIKVPAIQGKAPEARSGHTASNHNNTSIFYFGGWNAGRQFNDLHILELGNLSNGIDNDVKFAWSNPDITMGLPRWGHSGCSVKAIPNWRMFIFGGANSNGSNGNEPVTSCAYDNSVNVLDMGTMGWTTPGIEGDLPETRSDTPFAYDSKNSRLLMFGGWNGEWYGDMISMDIGNIVGPPYAIMGLEPDVGPVTGGVPITIRGIDFVKSDQITIRFLIAGKFVIFKREWFLAFICWKALSKYLHIVFF